MKRSIVMLLVVAVLVQGCATGSGDGGSNDAGSTTMQGSVLGGLLGAAAGALLSNDSGKGALIGGLVGVLVGTVAGSQVAEMQQNRVKAEAGLQQHIAQTESRLLLAKNYQKQMQQKIIALNRESLSLQAQERAGELAFEEKRRYLAKLSGTRQGLVADIQAFNEELQYNQQILDNKKKSLPDSKMNKNQFKQMQSELVALNKAVHEIRQQDSQLAEVEKQWK